MAKSYDAFREKLDAEHKWPTVYMFKFIVPQDKEDHIRSVFPEDNWNWEVKKSKNGAYLSFTSKKLINHADEVIEIYKTAHEIPGIIAL